eukprot:gene22055-26483_t
MRPVSVAVDTRTKTPLWKLVVLYPAVTSVFMFAALTTRTGIGLVVLGLVIFAVGASTYAMSERRMLRENSGVRVPYFAGPPVAPRHVDLLAAAGMPLLTSGAVLTVRASEAARPWVFISDGQNHPEHVRTLDISQRDIQLCTPTSKQRSTAAPRQALNGRCSEMSKSPESASLATWF